MKIGIFGSLHQKKDQIRKIFDLLQENKVEVYLQTRFYEYLKASLNLNYDIAGLIDDDNFSVDLAFSIGGDGTFLKTATMVQHKGIPILGINTGRLGFLADITDDDLECTLCDLVKGKYRVEERTQLMLTTCESCFGEYNHALNEVAVLKQDTASMLTIHAHINDEYLTSYQADGLIISTPTGSTAYSMSVGGPIMNPNASNFVLTAVAPHSLTTRPLVVEDDSVITLDIESRTQSFLVSLDGRSTILPTSTRLVVKKGNFPVKLVKGMDYSFYATLRSKLMWGADSRME